MRIFTAAGWKLTDLMPEFLKIGVTSDSYKLPIFDAERYVEFYRPLSTNEKLIIINEEDENHK